MTRDEARAESQNPACAWQCIFCGTWHPDTHEGTFNCIDDRYKIGGACVGCGDTREWPRQPEHWYGPGYGLLATDPPETWAWVRRHTRWLDKLRPYKPEQILRNTASS